MEIWNLVIEFQLQVNQCLRALYTLQLQRNPNEMQLTVCRYAKLLSGFSAKLLFSCALNYCVLEFHVSVVLESFTGILYFVCVLIAEYLWHGSVITKDSHFFLLLRYCRTERGTDREVCSRYSCIKPSDQQTVMNTGLLAPQTFCRAECHFEMASARWSYTASKVPHKE